MYDRGSVAVDCCAFYWNPDEEASQRPGSPEDLQFAGHNFRASEFEGAILNVQLGRLDRMLARMRDEKRVLTEAGEAAGLTSIRNNSLDHECGTHAGFLFETGKRARDFSLELGRRGRGQLPAPGHGPPRVHPLGSRSCASRGAHHPALDPFKIAANRKCRVRYTADMCSRSLDILGRAVLVPCHPDHRKPGILARVRAVEAAAKAAS